jgi:hypothetical protein
VIGLPNLINILCEVRAEAENTVFITDAECFLCKLGALVEETVDRRAWSIVNVENRRVKISTVNLPAYNISSLSDSNSVATVRRNLTVCVLGIFWKAS